MGFEVIKETGDVTNGGYLGFEGNELTTGSKVDDPPKNRLTSKITDHGGGGGVISFDASRNSGICGGAQQTEMAMIRVEQAEDVRGDVNNPKAEMNFMVNNGGTGDANMVKVLAFTADGITQINAAFLQSLRNLIGVNGGGGGATPMGRFYSGNGTWVWNYQDDGSVVMYNTHNSLDESTWTPQWAMRQNGSIESFVFG